MVPEDGRSRAKSLVSEVSPATLIPGRGTCVPCLMLDAVSGMQCPWGQPQSSHPALPGTALALCWPCTDLDPLLPKVLV